ncbi:hypothetical protein ACIQVK_19255 [Streptomyces sp. NPDC090493]|uniref:hypothetical protein n=1 Tax=Streptomyces sp. NPDC090493 TaxID=3365964 RepID=UPI003818F99B
MATGPENCRRDEKSVRSVRDGRQVGKGVAQVLAAASALNDHSADAGGRPLENCDVWTKAPSVWKPRQKSGDA